MNDDNIISIGDDFRQYDRKFWGWKDRARAAREDRQASLSDQWIMGGSGQLHPDHLMSWQLGPTKEDEARRRRRNIARLEEKHGIREKPWF
jgi:hypothetical protein